jgi:hypothetical protein
MQVQVLPRPPINEGKMKAILLATVAMLCAMPAYADAEQTYRNDIYGFGFALRGTIVCNLPRKDVENVFKVFAAMEAMKFYHAFPNTAGQWQLAGTEAFNRRVFQDGISTACSKFTHGEY